jgi:hypothetical protein
VQRKLWRLQCLWYTVGLICTMKDTHFSFYLLQEERAKLSDRDLEWQIAVYTRCNSGHVLCSADSGQAAGMNLGNMRTSPACACKRLQRPVRSSQRETADYQIVEVGEHSA